MDNTQIIDDYVNGIQTKDLAEKYNLTKQQIRKIMRDAGVSRPSGGRVTYDPQIAIDMWNDGNTLDQIATHLKVNRNSVYEQLKKFKIDTTDRSIIDRIKLKELLDEGKTDLEISEIMECSQVRVEQIRREEFGMYTDVYKQSMENKITMEAYLDNHECTFADFRSVFNTVDYGTLVKKYDEKFPNQRENAIRKGLIKTIEDDRIGDILNSLNNGESMHSIIRDHDISFNMLQNVIEHLCPDYTPKQYKIPTDIYNKLMNLDWMINAYNRTFELSTVGGIEKIAETEFNNEVTKDVVRHYFKKHNISISKLKDRMPQLNDKVWLEDQYKTKSYQQIADEIGVSHPTVRKALIEHEIEIKREKHISKIEKQLLDEIKSIYDGTIIENDRNVINPQEIDILLPDLKIGIEVCGLYWHSERFKPNNYHVDKMLICEEKGYRLITIFEDELMFNFDKVISKLKSIIGLNTNSIYARKCTIVQLSTAEACEFFETNHIQGYINASIRFGLKCGDDIVAAMTFKKHKDGVYDLSRFASSVNVVGGFSKLLKHFKKTVDYTSIFTFADLRWSSRLKNVYVVNGFQEVHVTKPAYFYNDYKSKKRLHRMNFRRDLIKDKLENFDDNLTERQNANNHGYYAIYDCGNVKYEMTKG